MSPRQPRGRNVQGVLLLDKPTGTSSNDALQTVKRMFNARKAGHTGSLDRLANGLLPLCMGEATKISGFLLEANKRYLSSFKLGVRTATGDAEGEVLETRPVGKIKQRVLERVLADFRGPIQQIPPMHSAIKHQGQRLYKLAHQGLVVERQPRPVTIHELEQLDFDGEVLDVEVYCSKGTYIRTLAEDIGEALGCGAHVVALRRIGAGPFDASGMYTLEQLQERAERGMQALDDLLLPMESAVADWPCVKLPDNAAYYLRKGQAVLVPHAPTSGWVRIYASKEQFMGVGEVLDDGRIAPRRLVQSGS